MPAAIIFAISFALLVDEIMLSAIFHVLLGAGNTVAAIGVALIGFSASGVFAYTIPVLQQPERVGVVYPRLILAFSCSLALSTLLIMRVPISHGDLVYASGDAAVQLWRFAVYHIAALPFFLGGLTIALLLRGHATDVSRLYFADLTGAALGCVASPSMLSALGAPGAILYSALPSAALAGWLGVRMRAFPRALVLLPVLLVALHGLFPGLRSFATLNSMGEVRAPAYRSFPIRAGELEFEKWALDAWTIIRSDRIPQQWDNFTGWGLSPRYSGPVPRIRLVNYNARFSTYVTEYTGDTGAIGTWLDADLTSLHYLLGRDFDRVLNIGAGGGREVLNALHHDVQHVTAVDVSDVVVNDIMKGYLRDFSGNLYEDPRVTAIAEEGRSYTERTSERFDLIDFSIVGGMNLEKMDLVRVEDLFTLEALRAYLARLTPDGVFSYVMYSTRADLVTAMGGSETIAQPYIPALRTLTGLRMALEEDGHAARFADHVLVAALRGVIDPRYDLVHIVVSKSPFSAAERHRFADLCREWGFEMLYPSVNSAAPAGDVYAGVIEARDLARFAETLAFSVWPATDDRPFQHPVDWRHVQKALGRGELWELLAGNPLISLGSSIGLVAVIVTLLPLVSGARRRPGLSGLRSGTGLLVYFALIGFGYMSIEIAALLRLQLYLGKPIYGLSVGLFAFLIASGLGSYLTADFNPGRLGRSAAGSAVLVVLAGLAFVGASEPLFASTISLSLSARVLIAVAAVFPVGVPMGMLFPLGIKLIAARDENLIPWAWATNGLMSVLAIVGTRITAVFLGFSRAFLIGLVMYGLVAAFVLAYESPRRRLPGLGRG